MNKVQLTSLEKQVWSALCLHVYEYTECEVKHLAEATELNQASIKGVIGSLVKKGLVRTCHEELGTLGIMTEYFEPQIVELEKDESFQNASMGYACDYYSETDWMNHCLSKIC